MSSLNMTNIDEITMRLVHYFITKENYQPILVNGLENEIWLENIEQKYSVIRINSNYIHNNEQLNFDIYKAKSVIKQIKKKTMSLTCNTLSILLNVGENVSIKNEEKNMEVCTITDIHELDGDNTITKLFPDFKNDIIDGVDDVEFFINVTNDINEKTEEKNRLYEKTFKKKRIVITYALIAINVIIFLLSLTGFIDIDLFAMNGERVKDGEYYRLFTSLFFHLGAVHLFCNMYSLYVIGTQLETVLGKIKFLAIYLISGLFGSLLSGIFNFSYSLGASGAIFGIVGSLIYFGYHYRLYLGSVIITQLIPVVLLNLAIGFMIPNIDNYAHVGGLIGGIFSSMMIGIEGKTKLSDRINGTIITILLAAFLCYMLFFQ